ncbi:hypothetical protein N7539_005532 [Penicillium diatomitis]|uniref:Uncharacterized protein n=1 Tax=Penicillium diatomitis TaxID=2819901 RepID=A0A9W9X713_9EURO|nr:uncharacterized protein N7539_005532 [Penicillium diatomitis]KAJ5485544.1 hypothetical protein N7539_005532 [Penicillium diatomitis]
MHRSSYAYADNVEQWPFVSRMAAEALARGDGLDAQGINTSGGPRRAASKVVSSAPSPALVDVVQQLNTILLTWIRLGSYLMP